MTDGELLERFVTARDEAAFEGLVRRHGPMVLGLCRRALRDDHEADDAFQATFLVLVRNARTIRKRDSLASWLYGVALRVTRKAKVGAKQRELVHHGEATVPIGPEADLDRSEVRPIVHDEVDRLPEKYRAPIVLCYFEGQSHEEAAAARLADRHGEGAPVPGPWYPPVPPGPARPGSFRWDWSPSWRTRRRPPSRRRWSKRPSIGPRGRRRRVILGPFDREFGRTSDRRAGESQVLAIPGPPGRAGRAPEPRTCRPGDRHGQPRRLVGRRHDLPERLRQPFLSLSYPVS